MKLYFAKKPNHTNINGVYYPESVLKPAINKLNERYRDRSAPFILHAQNPLNYDHSSNIIGSLGLLKFDESKQMYYAEVLSITEAYKTIIEDVGEENFLISCVTYVDGISATERYSITKIYFDNRFWLTMKPETNL